MDSIPSLESDIVHDNSPTNIINIDSYDDSLKTQFSNSTYMSSCDSLGFPHPIFEDNNDYDPNDVISRIANKKKNEKDKEKKDNKSLNNNKDDQKTLKDITTDKPNPKPKPKPKKRKEPPPLKLEYTITEADFIIRKKKSKNT